MVDIVLALEDGKAISLNSSQRLARNKYKSPSGLKLLSVETLHHSNTSLCLFVLVSLAWINSYACRINQLFSFTLNPKPEHSTRSNGLET